MVAVPVERTAVVVTVNVPLRAPPATVIVAGTAAKLLSLVKLTTSPAAGAALVRLTVPVDDTPPATLVGLSVTLEMLGSGSIVTVTAR